MRHHSVLLASVEQGRGGNHRNTVGAIRFRQIVTSRIGHPSIDHRTMRTSLASKNAHGDHEVETVAELIR